MYKMHHGINMQNADTIGTSHHEHFKKLSRDCLTVSHFSRCTLLAWSVTSCNGICKRQSSDAIAPIKLEASQSMVAPTIRANPHCILGMLQPTGNCNLVTMRIPERSCRTNRTLWRRWRLAWRPHERFWRRWLNSCTGVAGRCWLIAPRTWPCRCLRPSTFAHRM